jgi:Fur family transcriptional regulator, stress-responsive regulator
MTTDSAALLREHGIQVTAQRLAVLRAVAGQPHITADAVAEVVRTEIGAISLQSVYDALGLLVSKGLVRRIQPSRSPARFEERVGDNHHHLICRTCGRVVDVDCATGAAPCLTPIDDAGYEIDEAEVAYWGRCPDCLEQSRAASPGDRSTAATHGPATATPREAPSHPPTGGKSMSRSNTRRGRRPIRG